MILFHTGKRFEVVSTYAERGIPKQARFQWDRDARRWWTSDAAKAARLREYADDSAVAVIDRQVSAQLNQLEASRAVDSDFDVPSPPGCEYMPFQRAGVAYAAQRANTLIADEPGLGKTIQAAGLINILDTGVPMRILVVAPASLKINWRRELEKWLVRDFEILLANGKKFSGQEIPSRAVVVINYDILAKHTTWIHNTKWDVLVVDECHYLKNPKARRTQQVVGKWDSVNRCWATPPISADHKLMLTGTPIVNRPIELWPVLHYLDGANWHNFMGFAKSYCNAFHNGYGWDFTGASNLDDLQRKLRGTLMVRRLKENVLTELPAKSRQVIEIPALGVSKIIREELKAYDQHKARIDTLRQAVAAAKAQWLQDRKNADYKEQYRRAVYTLRDAVSVEFSDTAKYRKQTAMAKVPYVAEHVNNLVESGIKVVVFAHHHDVIDALMTEFGHRAVKLDGRDSAAAKQDAVDRFQTDDVVRVFVGGITAAGLGITLTASSHVIFAELDWVPGNLSQAEDRCHRIGQKDSVMVQHLVLEGSLDVNIANQLVGKQSVIDQALDGPAFGTETRKVS